MSETLHNEDEIALCNEAFVWLQKPGDAVTPPMTDAARERIARSVCGEVDLLPMHISTLPESTRLVAALYFAGFSRPLLEDLGYPEVEAQLRQAGVLRSIETEATATAVPELVQDIPPTQNVGKNPELSPRRPLRRHRQIGNYVTTEPKEKRDSDENDDFEQSLRGVHLTNDIIKDYLTQIGKESLLTAEQEVELSKGIEAGQFAEKILVVRGGVAVKDIPADGYSTGRVTMTDSELEAIACRGKEAKDRMIRANLRLVVNVAKRSRTTPSHGLEDNISHGVIGLIRAVEKFDYAKGYKFSTYATWWIKRSITRGQIEAETIRLSHHQLDQIRKVRAAQHTFLDNNGRAPSIAEIAGMARMSEGEVGELLALPRAVVSLDMPLKDGADATFGDVIAITEDTQSPNDIKAEVLEGLLGYLTNPKEIQMLRMRYGLNDYSGGMGLKEIGEQFGLTSERVRQIIGKAIVQLHAAALKSGIDLSDVL